MEDLVKPSVPWQIFLTFSFDLDNPFEYGLLKDITRTKCWIKVLRRINDIGLFLIPSTESRLKSLNIYGG